PRASSGFSGDSRPYAEALLSGRFWHAGPHDVKPDSPLSTVGEGLVLVAEQLIHGARGVVATRFTDGPGRERRDRFCFWDRGEQHRGGRHLGAMADLDI